MDTKETSSTGWQFTGHFLIDYGLASILVLAAGDRIDEWAVAEIPDKIDEETIKKAAERIEHDLCHEYYFLDRSTFFVPNAQFNQGPKADRDKNTPKRREAVQVARDAAIQALQPGDSICHLCGRLSDTVIPAKKHLVPLLLGDTNFYGDIAPGIMVCGLCRFAVLAALVCSAAPSVSTTIIPHIQDIRILKRLAREARQELFARDEKEEKGTSKHLLFLRVIENVVRDLSISRQRSPLTIWVFMGGNHPDFTDVEKHAIPNCLIDLLHHLYNEVEISANKLGTKPFHMLNLLIDRVHLARTKKKRDDKWTPADALADIEKFIDGRYLPRRGDPWYTIRRYMEEVQGMDRSLIASITQIGIALGEWALSEYGEEKAEEEANRQIDKHHRPGGLFSLCYDLVSEGYLQAQDTFDAFEMHRTRILEYVRVAAIDYIRCKREGRNFDTEPLQVRTSSDAARLIERIAEIAASRPDAPNIYERLLRDQSGYNYLMKVYRHLVLYGHLSWREYLTIMPPDFVDDESEADRNKKVMRRYRDYLILCLTEKLRHRIKPTTRPERGIDEEDEEDEEDDEEL